MDEPQESMKTAQLPELSDDAATNPPQQSDDTSHLTSSPIEQQPGAAIATVEEQEKEQTTGKVYQRESPSDVSAAASDGRQPSYLSWWTDEDRRKLEQLCTTYFNSCKAGKTPYTLSKHWGEVASHFEGRSANACKKRWSRGLLGASNPSNPNTVSKFSVQVY